VNLAVIPDLRRHLLEALVIVALGAVIGLSVNYRLIGALLEGRLAPPAPVPTANGYPTPITLGQLQEALAAGGIVAVDARDADSYAEGHLPGALSLPLEEAEARLEAFRLRVDPATALAVYCNGYGCPDSFDLAIKLIAAGYASVAVFEGGLPEWRDAGLAVEEGAP
jgi:rhodanese-related sulfurtransferase